MMTAACFYGDLDGVQRNAELWRQLSNSLEVKTFFTIFSDYCPWVHSQLPRDARVHYTQPTFWRDVWHCRTLCVEEGALNLPLTWYARQRGQNICMDQVRSSNMAFARVWLADLSVSAHLPNNRSQWDPTALVFTQPPGYMGPNDSCIWGSMPNIMKYVRARSHHDHVLTTLQTTQIHYEFKEAS